MENNEQGFRYTYSAAQRQEVESIRKKYMPAQEDKMEQLRALHNSASRKAQIRSLSLGVIGALIMGFGMSLVMTQIGSILGLDLTLSMVLGIVNGVAGMVLTALAYPVYERTLKKERKRIAPEILRLSQELLE